jgi:hypothetical protein
MLLCPHQFSLVTQIADLKSLFEEVKTPAAEDAAAKVASRKSRSRSRYAHEF